MGQWTKKFEQAVEALNRGDVDLAISVGSFDNKVEYVDPGLPQPLHGVEELRRFFETFIRAFPDAKFTIRRAIEDDQSLAVELTWTGTQLGPLPMGGIPSTGKKVEIHGCDVLEIRGDKIVEVRVYLDLFTLMGQLGLAPISATSGATA